MFTICDAIVDCQFPFPRMRCGARTRVFCHLPSSWTDFHKLIDTRCGLGGISHGASAIGLHTTVANDMNPRMVELHAAHSTCEHVVGDIGDLHVVADIWVKCDRAAVLAAGFSCQPFSSLGDHLGGADPRASTLPKVLPAAYLLQVKVIMLECVVPAKSDLCVNQMLEKFMALTGFTMEVVTLDLQNAWPCRRCWSWWLLIH